METNQLNIFDGKNDPFASFSVEAKTFFFSCTISKSNAKLFLQQEQATVFLINCCPLFSQTRLGNRFVSHFVLFHKQTAHKNEDFIAPITTAMSFKLLFKQRCSIFSTVLK